MNEIVTKEFFGRSVDFLKRDQGESGDLWLTAEQAAIPLGLKSANSVRVLFRRHKGEFIEGVEFAVVRLAVKGTRDSLSREVETLVFSLAGLDHVALLVRTEIGKKARRWTTDLRAQIRSGEKSIVDTAKLLDYIAKLEARIKASEERELRLVDLSARQASAIASALATRRYQKALEGRLLAELKIGQKRFSFREDGRPLLGCAVGAEA